MLIHALLLHTLTHTHSCAHTHTLVHTHTHTHSWTLFHSLSHTRAHTRAHSLMFRSRLCCLCPHGIIEGEAVSEKKLFCFVKVFLWRRSLQEFCQRNLKSSEDSFEKKWNRLEMNWNRNLKKPVDKTLERKKHKKVSVVASDEQHQQDDNYNNNNDGR